MSNRGKRRHIITIQAATNVPDGYGGSVETWAKFISSWAEIWTLKTSEEVINGKLTPISRLVFRIQYRRGITEAMRALKGATIYKIIGIRNLEERNETLEITCRRDG
jgi:SPP1 family predicted phage head-tail adaptor